MARPDYYSPKKKYGYSPSSTANADDECPDHPDLCLLRDAAADERGAIADYLRCAAETCLDEIFLSVAEDEMHHYVELMRLISRYDPVQAEIFEEKDLDFLVMKRPMGRRPKWIKPKKSQADPAAAIAAPGKKELTSVCCLTKAIQDELHTINKYQRYMNQAREPRVKDYFCELMNEEKEHVAIFTAALFELTHEPPAGDGD